MTFRNIAVFLCSFSLLFAFSSISFVNAQGSQGVFDPSGGRVVDPPRTTGSFSIENPLHAKSISDFLRDLFRAIVKIGLPIVVLFMVYAGFMFVTARGKPEELNKAKMNFMYVVVGTAIFLGAWALAEIIAATIRQLGV